MFNGHNIVGFNKEDIHIYKSMKREWTEQYLYHRSSPKVWKRHRNPFSFCGELLNAFFV